MKAQKSSWNRQRFEAGVPIPYSSAFTAEEFEQIQDGLVPKEMEDKWFIYYESPYLYLHRSWTGQPVYRLKFAEHKRGVSVVEAVWAEELAMSSEQTEAYQAQLVDFLICDLLLGQSKPFPRPAGVDGSLASVYQHHVSGTAYPDQPVAARRPWWRRTLATARNLLSRPPQNEERPHGKLICESHVIGRTAAGNLLEVLLAGVDRASYADEISRFLKKAIEDHAPVAGVVINLLNYQYETGNHMACLIPAFGHKADKGVRPVCIVATSRTYSSLYSLFEDGNLLSALPLKFVSSTEEAQAELERQF